MSKGNLSRRKQADNVLDKINIEIRVLRIINWIEASYMMTTLQYMFQTHTLT